MSTSIREFVAKCDGCGMIRIRSRCIEKFERKLHRANCAAGTMHSRIEMYCFGCYGESFDHVAVPVDESLDDQVDWPERCPCGCNKTWDERDHKQGCPCTYDDDY
jgi:hypothetical protein